jgi:hypothetical protein
MKINSIYMDGMDGAPLILDTQYNIIIERSVCKITSEMRLSPVIWVQ